MTLSIMTLSIMTLSIMTLSIMTLSIIIIKCDTVRNGSFVTLSVVYADCHISAIFAERHGAI